MVVLKILGAIVIIIIGTLLLIDIEKYKKKNKETYPYDENNNKISSLVFRFYGLIFCLYLVAFYLIASVTG